MGRDLTRLALAVCCLLTLAQPFHSRAEKRAREERSGLLAVGEPAPDWKLGDARGRTHTLSEYRGDGRVVYSHAGAEHKNLGELIEKHLASTK